VLEGGASVSSDEIVEVPLLVEEVEAEDEVEAEVEVEVEDVEDVDGAEADDEDDNEFSETAAESFKVNPYFKKG